MSKSILETSPEYDFDDYDLRLAREWLDNEQKLIKENKYKDETAIYNIMFFQALKLTFSLLSKRAKPHIVYKSIIRVHRRYEACAPSTEPDIYYGYLDTVIPVIKKHLPNASFFRFYCPIGSISRNQGRVNDEALLKKEKQQ
jgi:hypothetical protein